MTFHTSEHRIANVPNPPKPTALKIMQGTAARNPQRLNRAEPIASGEPVPPDWLPASGPARDAWNRLLPPLMRMRILSDGDAEALALGCRALEEYLTARQDDESWRRADAAWKRYGAMLGWFGLTPSARTKVQSLPVDRDDPLEKWASG